MQKAERSGPHHTPRIDEPLQKQKLRTLPVSSQESCVTSLPSWIATCSTPRPLTLPTTPPDAWQGHQHLGNSQNGKPHPGLSENTSLQSSWQAGHLPSLLLQAPGEKGVKVKRGLEALEFGLGAETSREGGGDCFRGLVGWRESYPNKRQSLAIRWPWLQVSRELVPGTVNYCFLALKKKRGSQVCLPGEGAVHGEERGGGERRKGGLFDLRQVSPSG